MAGSYHWYLLNFLLASKLCQSGCTILNSCQQRMRGLTQLLLTRCRDGQSLGYSHLNKGVVVSHCGFSFHFPNDLTDVEHLFICLYPSAYLW